MNQDKSSAGQQFVLERQLYRQTKTGLIPSIKSILCLTLPDGVQPYEVQKMYPGWELTLWRII